MITFQEYEQAADKSAFIIDAMDKHLASSITMRENERYYYGENPFLDTLDNKLNLTGDSGNNASIDLTPTIKIPSGFFGIIVGHIVGRLWDNPVQIGSTEKDENGKSKIIDPDIIFGEDFSCDVHQIAIFSAIHGVCYAFYNHDKIEMFKATEYLPLPDERTGAHRAGIRFWRVAEEKPWVVQMFTSNGYTEWSREHNGVTLIHVGDFKYRKNIPVGGENFVDSTPITEGEPYPDYPIVPLYTNPQRRSEMTAPIKARINAYDIKETAFMDEALKAKFVMWIFKGYGGDPDKLKGILKTMKELGLIAGGDTDDTHIEGKTMDIPYNSHEATLQRIEEAIYTFARITNPNILITGGVTQVAIGAATDREEVKMTEVESEARKFIKRLLKISGSDYEYISFTHRTLSNDLETVQMVTQGVPDLDFMSRVELNPGIPQEMKSEIVARHDAESIGMSDDDIANFDAKFKQILAAMGGNPEDGEGGEQL